MSNDHDERGAPVLDRAAFLSKRPPARVRAVTVPELGGTVYVRAFDGHGRDTWEVAMREQREGKRWNVRALMVALGACDEHGEALFTLDDVEALGRYDWRVLEPLAEAVDELNALSGAHREAVAGNSSRPATNGSGTVSPAT